MTLEIDRKRTLSRLRRGHLLHREFREGVEAFWFETPLEDVPAAIIAKIQEHGIKGYAVLPEGDGLFDAGTSQTWRATKTRAAS